MNNKKSPLPRILVIDDLFGRTHLDRRNEERARLCGSHYRLEDITGDEVGKNTLKVKNPVAQAVFYRGQTPSRSVVGDIVENDLEGVLQIIRDGWITANQPKWSLVLLDLCFYTGPVTEESNRKVLGMPEGRVGDDNPSNYFGLKLLDAIHLKFPDLPVVILSSKSRNEVSREFSIKGALGFLARGDAAGSDELKEYLWRHGLIPDESGEIIGHSKALLLALRAARRSARNQRNILIRGERGTGKELLADYIHRQSSRSGNLISVNSATLTHDLFASELFGIEGRTATGVDARRGLIEDANDGDLFFDEIKDMPPQVQAAILRVIQERELVRVGGRQTIPINVRFLSATNIDIESMAATESFRSDLLDRLQGERFYIPPLRERKEDIPLLVDKFVREAETECMTSFTREIDPEAIVKLCDYDWSGNIRELRNCIFKAVSDYPDVEHLVPLHIQLPNEAKHSYEKVLPPKFQSRNSEEKDEFNSLNDLIKIIEEFNFQSVNPAKWAGKLSKLKSAYAQLLARYLFAALEATRKPTPENPDGELLISPALKLMTGDKSLKTPKAADIIKQILKDCPDKLDSPELKLAYESALSLRPKKAQTKQRDE